MTDSATAPQYVEFATTSNFSFLRGASHAEELIATAVHLGLSGFGLADRNSVAGVVRAHAALRDDARERGQPTPLRYHPGARLVFIDGTPDVLAYPRHRKGWARLCRLLTLGNRRAEKGDCHLTETDLLDHADGLSLIVVPKASNPATALPSLSRLREAVPGFVRLAAAMICTAAWPHTPKQPKLRAYL